MLKAENEIAIKLRKKQEDAIKREIRNEKAREKREKKALKRYRPKLPRKIQIIKNVEKGNWMESWSKPRKRSPALIPHPFRLLALGSVGRGKTLTMKNIFLAHQASSRPFKEVYICTCSLESKEWNDLEPTGLMNELPGIGFFNAKKKTALIIDDFEMERLSSDARRRLSTIFRFISTHRNLSVMCGYQSFFDVNSLIRKCSNVFLLYKPTALNEITMIGNRVGIDPDDLHNMFNTICSGPYDSIMVDRSVGTPYPLRKNVFEIIETKSDSEGEDDA